MAILEKPSRAVMPIETEDKMSTSHIHLENQKANVADEAEHKLAIGQAFKLYYKAVIWSATLSMALVMESYGKLVFLSRTISGSSCGSCLRI